MNKQEKAAPTPKKTEKKQRFSWVIRAADRQHPPRRPAGNCNCK